MSLPHLLKGTECERYCFLLKKGIPYDVALQEARNPASELIFPEEGMLNVLRAHPDPWVYETVKENKSLFATGFRKAFREQYDMGATVQEAAEAALRKTDSMAAAQCWENEHRRTQASSLAKIKLAIAYANGTRISKDFYLTFLEKVKKTIDPYYPEIGPVPHIVDCCYMKKLGYIRIFCADKATVEWLVNFVRSAQFKTTVTLFIMRERRFERSTILSTCLENISPDEVKTVLKSLRKLNSDVDMRQWQLLSTQFREDGKALDAFILVPKSDLKKLKPKNYELHYKLSKLKLSVISREDKARHSHKYSLQGIFPNIGAPGHILELIESENDNINTFQWEVIPKRYYKKYVWLQFYLDEQSADTIEQNHNQLNFMSQKIKLSSKIKKIDSILKSKK